MKRLSAILFLAILLFNIYGYRFVIVSMEEKSVAAIETKVDKQDYTDDELISVKTVLHLPYYTSSNDYERAYGSINIDGKDYEYVKRRVHNDTLELLCLPNLDKTKLKAAGNDIAKASADGNTAPIKKSGTTLKISLPDFCQSINAFSASVESSNKQVYSSYNSRFSSTNYSMQQERPPQAV